VHHVFSGRHRHNRIINGTAQRVVAEDAREATIAQPRRQLHPTLQIARNAKLVARHVGASRVNLIILRDNLGAPDVVLIVEAAV
jgi:hypothetical protein